MSQNEIPLLIKRDSLEWRISQKQTLLSSYDPFKFPANLNDAKNHGLARRVSHPISLSSSESSPTRCPCCMQPIQNDLIPLTCKLQQLTHLGLAYPLYFTFIKAATFLMIVHFLMIGIAELVLNLTGSQCYLLKTDTRICKLSFMNSLSFEDQTVLEVQNVLNIAFIFLSIILIEIIKFHSLMFKIKVQKQQRSPADYSILIKGLPHDITVYQLSQFMAEELQSLRVDSSLAKIYLVYDVKEYVSLYAKKREVYQYKIGVADQYAKIVQNANEEDDSYKRRDKFKKAEMIFEELSEANNTYLTIQQEILKYEESFRIIVSNLQNEDIIEQKEVPKRLKFSGKCIITLNHSLSAKKLIQHYRLTFKESLIYKIQETLKLDSEYTKKYRGNIVKIEKAPDPSDVVFGNLGSENIKKLKHRVQVTLIVTFMIVLSCVILTFTKKQFNQTKATSSNPVVYSFLTSLLVALLNSILGRLIRYFSNDEFYSTQSSYYFSVAIRVTVVNVVNMTLTTVIANLATSYLVMQSTYPGINISFIGLVNDFFFVNATNSLLAIIFVFFDYRFAYRKLNQLYITKFKKVTQSEANLAFQNQPVDMAYKYSHGYRLFLFTATVAPFIPNAIAVSIGVAFIIYFVDKYLLLRRWMCQYKLGYALSAKMLRILNMYPLFLSFSNFMIMCIPMVSSPSKPTVHFYLSLSIFIFTAIIQMLPTGIILKLLIQMFKKEQTQSHDITYKQMQSKFVDDYSNYYPYFKVTKQNMVIGDDVSSMSSGSNSPRKNKLLDETNKKLSQSVLGLLRDYMDHKKFNFKT